MGGEVTTNHKEINEQQYFLITPNFVFLSKSTMNFETNCI